MDERETAVDAIVGGERAEANERMLYAALLTRAAALSPPLLGSASRLFQSFFIGGFESAIPLWRPSRRSAALMLAPALCQPSLRSVAIWNLIERGLFFPKIPKENDMPIDKDRTDGSVNQAKGSLKETAGKLTGDSKLEAEGKTDKLGGKIQNAIGGIKDAIKGK